jgi:ketosteroid isomerase-like protein
MTLADERSAMIDALMAWQAQDLDLLLTYFADDVLYLINVDGIQVPYAMSAVGKEDLRGRLQLVIDTFLLERYTVEKIVHDADHSRAYAHGVYRHRATGEPLDIRFRFCAWISNGLLVRVHELHDAAYLQAFEKFVFHLAAAAHEG